MRKIILFCLILLFVPSVESLRVHVEGNWNISQVDDLINDTSELLDEWGVKWIRFRGYKHSEYAATYCCTTKGIRIYNTERNQVTANIRKNLYHEIGHRIQQKEFNRCDASFLSERFSDSYAVFMTKRDGFGFDDALLRWYELD